MPSGSRISTRSSTTPRSWRWPTETVSRWRPTARSCSRCTTSTTLRRPPSPATGWSSSARRLSTGGRYFRYCSFQRSKHSVAQWWNVGLWLANFFCPDLHWWVTTIVGKPSAAYQPTRPTQPFIILGSINRVPALIGWDKGGNVTSTGWHVTLCDPIRHASFRSTLAARHLRTAIHDYFTLLINGDRCCL